MKISHFTALFLLGMLTAACSGDKNADSTGGAEQNKPEAAATEPAESKPEAAATEPAESKPEAAATEPAESKPEAAAPKAGEGKPEAAAPKAGEGQPEASAPKAAISESDALFLNKKPVSNSVKNTEMYNTLVKKEKGAKTEMISDFNKLADLAAEKKVSEDLIKHYKQCVKNYSDSIDGNTPDKYRQHVEVLDNLLEAALNLGPVDPDFLTDKMLVYALCFLKFSYMYSAEEVTEEEFSLLKDKFTQIDEEIKKKQTNTEERESK